MFSLDDILNSRTFRIKLLLCHKLISTLLIKSICLMSIDYSWWSHTFYVVYWLTGHETPSYVLTYLLCCVLVDWA